MGIIRTLRQGPPDIHADIAERFARVAERVLPPREAVKRTLRAFQQEDADIEDERWDGLYA